MNVIKHDGSVEPLHPEKRTKSLEWAHEGLDVSVQDVEDSVALHFYDGIKTSDILDATIKTCRDMSTLKSPDYDIMGMRLVMQKLYKAAYHSTKPWPLYSYLYQKIEDAYYSETLLESFTIDEISDLDKHIDHSRDFTFTLSGIEKFIDAYFIKGCDETPQMLFMAVAMDIFRDYHKDRMTYIKHMYDRLSKFHISLPSPEMQALRTENTDYASCITIRFGDKIKSWTEGKSATIKHTVASAGIGIDLADVASVGDKVKSGKIIHAGKVKLMRAIDADIQTSSQMNRRGQAVTYVNIFDPEIRHILSLKSPRTAIEQRIQDLKHGIKMSGYMYHRMNKNLPIYLFSAREFPEVHAAYGTKTPEEFAPIYEAAIETVISNNPNHPYIPGSELMELFASERFENGIYYIMNVDNANTSSSWKKIVRQFNICVTGDTKILTKDYGYIPISDVAGKTLEVWNGKSWSMTPLFKTSDYSKVLTVKLSNGTTIKATEYHKWYIQNSYHGKPVETRTVDLKVGDKLEKFSLEPIAHGTDTLDKAYDSGFKTGDGTDNADGSSQITFYSEQKKDIIKHLSGYTSISSTVSYNKSESDRIVVRYDKSATKNMFAKYVVPSISFSVQTRLDWLAGLIDSDGCLLTLPDGAYSIQIISSKPDFLEKVKLMLQELGVHSSSTVRQQEGYYKLPMNDGSSKSREYWCQETRVLSITHSGLVHLNNLGYKGYRISLPDQLRTRDCQAFTAVVSVTDNDEFAETFCGSEPERHRLMFDGVLTGNCLEYGAPIEPIDEDFPNRPDIGVCVLSNINQALVSIDELPEVCDLLVRAQSHIMLRQEHPTTQANAFVKMYRDIGIGIGSHAHWLAQNHWRYGDYDALLSHFTYMEAFQYNLMLSSTHLAEELGRAPGFSDTTYSDLVMPQDRANRHIASLISDIASGEPHIHQDWNYLRTRVGEFGMYNCGLSMIPPGETSSIIGNMTSGLEPIRDLMTIKSSKSISIKQIAPGFPKLAQYYDPAFDRKITPNYIMHVAVTQFWIDKSISANSYYNPELYPDGKVPIKELISDIFLAWKFGLKAWYYNNVKSPDEITIEQKSCSGDGCEI